MEKRSLLLLKTFLMLVVITESAVIVPRKPVNIPSKIPVIEEDKKLEPNPGIRNQGSGSYDSSGVEYDTRGISGQPDYDYGRPGAIDENEPGMKPEIIPDEDETIDKGDGSSKPDDEVYFEPLDGEDSGITEDDEDEESKPSTDEYDESKPSIDEDNESKPSIDEDNESKPSTDEDDELKPSTVETDKKVPDINHGEDNGDEKGSNHFFGGSIFDTPFFNLNKVRKYFNQMERALGQVFHQVLDEARLLNGTYANTTEEEVEIGGRKYVVQKSVIKGADKHSSIYVETLSTKPKSGSTKDIKGIDRKNNTKE